MGNLKTLIVFRLHLCLISLLELCRLACNRRQSSVFRIEAMLTRWFVGLVNLVRIRHIQHMWWETQTVSVRRHGWQRSGPDQLEDLLLRLLLAVDPPIPIPEVPPVEKLQCLVTETRTESVVAGRKSPGVCGTRTDAAVVPVWTAADEAAP